MLSVFCTIVLRRQIRMHPFNNGMSSRMLHYLILAIALIACSAPPILRDFSQSPPEIISLEENVLQVVNDYRKTQGLKALREEAAITQPCRSHSKSMARRGEAFHGRLDLRVQQIEKTILCASVKENVATVMGRRDIAAAALEGWLKSAEHRETILGPFDLTGVGVARDSSGTYYITQMFIVTR